MEQQEFEKQTEQIKKRNKRQNRNIIIGIGIFILFVIMINILSQKEKSIEKHKTDYELGMEYYNIADFRTAKFLFQKVDTLDYNYADAQKKIKICDKQLAEEELAYKKWLKTKAGKYYTFCQNKGAYVSKEDCELASKNRIWIGMNYWLLVAMRGNPNHINTSNYGYGNEYQYCWNDYTISCFYDNNGDDLIDAYN